MAKAPEPTQLVSDPDSPHYDPVSPFYDVTADPSSRFYVGRLAGDQLSGDEIRAEVIDTVDRFTGPPGGFLDLLFGSTKDSMIQSAYQHRIKSARDGLGADMELRAPGEEPKTLWFNASHEQMVAVINSNADSSVVAVSSEEWVRLGNDLSEHQRAFGGAINDSLGNWQGEAGDAARTHLAAVAKWLGSTAEGSVLTGLGHRPQRRRGGPRHGGDVRWRPSGRRDSGVGDGHAAILAVSRRGTGVHDRRLPAAGAGHAGGHVDC
jgi:hypothetical protein